MSCFKCCELDEAKRVTFNSIVKVEYFETIPIETDVSWQQVARDRHRFKRCSLDIEHKISWIFNSQHRHRVFTRHYKDIV